MDVLACCTVCRPRYQRLVDHIYPRSRYAADGLVQNNMQKLTFYSISHPEKLNRIGIYLVKRLSRDLYRQRHNEIKVAVDAMDQLLKSCHGSPSLSQFTESYLRMVQRLLETSNLRMERLATDLFVRFSSLEEDSPSYHRQYDFFISKFSQMCHASLGDAAEVRQQRFNGLRGLRGVIWKSASDDLQAANIWEKQHMDKIVPSILYNLQQEDEEKSGGENRKGENFEEGAMGEIPSATSALLIGGGATAAAADEQFGGVVGGPTAEEADPRALALQCLRELFGKCSFGSLKAALQPVLQHFDAHEKWIPPAHFAQATFKAILYSIPAQNSSFVVQELIQHLEYMANQRAVERIGVATVLANIVSITGATIGPLLLAIFSALMKRLRASVDYQHSRQCTDVEAEQRFQETIVNALGDFAASLPIYQKLEMMAFTMGNIPVVIEEEGGAASTAPAVREEGVPLTELSVGGGGAHPASGSKQPRPMASPALLRRHSSSEAFLQKVLVRTLLKVATTYKTFYMASVFTDPFLRTLLQLAYIPRDAEVRLNALHILSTLLDRHDNLTALEHLPSPMSKSDSNEMEGSGSSGDEDGELPPLTVEKCSRQDQLFMRKQVPMIATALYRSACVFMGSQRPPEASSEVEEVGKTEVEKEKEGERNAAEKRMRDYYDAILCVMALLCVEVPSDENLVELFRLAFALQQLAVEATSLAPASQFIGDHAAYLHELTAKFMNFSSQLMALPALRHHVQQILEARKPQRQVILEGGNSGSRRGSMLLGGDEEKERGMGKEADEEGERNNCEGLPPPSTATAPTIHDKRRRLSALHYIDSLSQPEVLLTATAAGESTVLFNINVVAEALRQGSTSKEHIQRLFLPFKPRGGAASISAQGQQSANASYPGVYGCGKTALHATAAAPLHPGELLERTASPSGVVLSQSLSFGRGGGEERGVGADEEKIREMLMLKRQGTLAPDGGEVSSETASRNISIDTSSIDWSPPDTPKCESRRNTIFKSDAMESTLLTVDALREAVHAPRDRAEEERRDKEKSRQILQQFRNKTVEQLSAALGRRLDIRRSGDSSQEEIPEVDGADADGGNGRRGGGEEEEARGQPESLADTIQRLVKRNEEWTKMHEFGHPAGGEIRNLFDINLPTWMASK